MKKLLLLLSILVFSVTAANAQSTKRMLDNAVSMINRNCPIALDNETTLKSAYLTKQYLIFDCAFDEKNVEIPKAKEHKKELMSTFRNMLKEMVKDENSASLFDLVAANRKGVEFKLTGKTTKETLELKFSADEVAQMTDYTSLNYK